MLKVLIIAALLGQFRLELPPQTAAPVAPPSSSTMRGKSPDAVPQGAASANTPSKPHSNAPSKLEPVKPSKADNRPVIFYWSTTDGSCFPCGKFHAFKDSPAGRNFPARFEPLSKMPEGAENGIPYFEHIRKDGSKWTLTGYCCDYHMEKAFRNLLGHASAARWKGVDADFEHDGEYRVAASRPVKLPLKAQVQQAFAGFKQLHIGKFSIQHHCNDGDRVLRVMGRNKSKPGLLAVCGQSGRVDITAPGSLLPDGKLGFAYRIYSDTRVGFDPDEVIIDWGTPKATASQQACGFMGLEVLGLISFIGGLLQSNVELTLPRDMAIAGEFVGGKVAAAFKDRMSPYASMHISNWWEQRAYVTTVDVSESEATLKTNGRWPLPKKQVIAFD